MFNLDIPTLQVASVLLVTGTLIALLVFWKNHKLKVQNYFWIAGIVTYSLAFFLILARAHIEQVLLNVCVDMSRYVSSMFFLYAIGKSQHREWPALPGIVMTVCMGIAAWYFSYFEVGAEARMALVAVFTGLTCFFSAWAITQAPHFKWRSAELPLFVLFALFALLNIGKVLYVGAIDITDNSYLTLAYFSSAFFIAALTFILILIGYDKLEQDRVLLRAKDLQENAARLQRVEKRWLLALEYSNAGAWELHRDTNMITLTSQWAKMLGLAPQEQTVSLREYLHYVHPDDWSKLLAQRHAVESGSSHIVNSEHRLKRSNGSWLWVYSRGQNISTPGTNDFNKIIGVDMDITNNKINQNKLEQAIAEAKQATSIALQANKAKSSFLANVSHEIRTPMNAILGFSQLMTDDATLTSQQRENLDIITNSAQHLLGLIDDILNLSRIDSGHYKIDNKLLDPAALFHEIAKYFEKKPFQADVEFEVDISAQLPALIQTDPKAIRQICINLLTNAFKFTPQGTITFRVNMARKSAWQGVLDINVQDTGIGVSAHDQQIIFDAFEQGESERAIAEGYGLGLSICKNLVALLGGDISLSSALTQGSCFSIRLPVVVLAAHTTPHLPDIASTDQLQTAWAGLKVLIVDDIGSNRKLLCRFLASAAMDIREVTSAAAALLEISTWRPALVLMDIRMPAMAGDDAISALRSNTAYAYLPIIAITANAMEGEQDRLLKIGANAVISKPFLKDELLRKISMVLDPLPSLSGVRGAALHRMALENPLSGSASEAACEAISSTTPETAPAVPAAVSFPVASEMPSEPELPIIRTGSTDVSGILVVDDNRANQRLLYSQLKSLGLHADVAADGKVGLDLWHRKQHRIVFTDCSMPVMNGFDLSRHIRRLEADREAARPSAGKRALIIAVTGAPEEFTEKCRAAGMDDILGKPLLLQSLSQMLTKHRAIGLHANLPDIARVD